MKRLTHSRAIYNSGQLVISKHAVRVTQQPPQIFLKNRPHHRLLGSSSKGFDNSNGDATEDTSSSSASDTTPDNHRVGNLAEKLNLEIVRGPCFPRQFSVF